MSGGFFRGTSADQDTRFSNKQAKLLKSQKFAPELDHLVNMTKVKMDVVRPWIATRATELLGFEDEVLINFVYGLLDGKEVDGKQIQIQLTGFMEKNTGKFMKELWCLLLSAQTNASGVPQQFLDAKEEETRKKKVEADRITQEIQKRKEKEMRESELEKQKRMDGEVDVMRPVNAASDPEHKHLVSRASGRESDRRHSSRRKSRHSTSPYSDIHSPPSIRSTPSATRSSSKSFSNSRSYSEDGHKSRSISGSPHPRRRSISTEKRYLSPPKHPISPHHKRSPSIPQSPTRRTFHSHRRTPSLVRRRSPWRRRSPSPRRRRSPSPRWRRSPSPRRHRSPSPLRRKSPSPWRRRSPSPWRHRSPSPVQRRSPSLRRRRSPIQASRRSPSPSRRMFPSSWRRSRSPRRRSPPSSVRRTSPPPRSQKHHRLLPSPRRRSPRRSPRMHASDLQDSPRQKDRSRSPYNTQNPSSQRRRSMSKDGVNGVDFRRYQHDNASQRERGKRSPLRNSLERSDTEQLESGPKGLNSASRQHTISLRSPQRDPRDQYDARKRLPPLSDLPKTSPNRSEYSPLVQSLNPNGHRTLSSSESLSRETGRRTTRHESPETSREEEDISDAMESARDKTDTLHNKSNHSPRYAGQQKFAAKAFDTEAYSPNLTVLKQSAGPAILELRKKEHDNRSDVDFKERHTRQVSHSSEEIEYGPGRVVGETISHDKVHDERLFAKKLSRDPTSSSRERSINERDLIKKSYSKEDYRPTDNKRPRLQDEYSTRHETDSVPKNRRMGEGKQVDAVDSDSEENETYKHQISEKLSYKKSERQKAAYGDENKYDSQRDDRKEAKRRRKEEKKLRKDEKRRRREERHQRREERRAVKLKAKYMDTVTPPSDYEKKIAADDSDCDVDTRGDLHLTDTEEAESEQKRLEIELRKKALESIRAKKGISH